MSNSSETVGLFPKGSPEIAEVRMRFSSVFRNEAYQWGQDFSLLNKDFTASIQVNY
jgi:hypothetical protein